jgi:23S rRNA G2069 N7-methylase RlmK/C1962 C5-methylase RlmI
MLDKNFKHKLARSDLQPRALEQNRTERSYSRNQKKKMEVSETYAEEGNRLGRKAWNPQGRKRRGTSRRTWKIAIDEEALKDKYEKKLGSYSCILRINDDDDTNLVGNYGVVQEGSALYVSKE